MTYRGMFPVMGILLLAVANRSVATTASVQIVAFIAKVINISISESTSPSSAPVIDIQTNSPQSFDITTQKLPTDGSSGKTYAVEISAR